MTTPQTNNLGTVALVFSVTGLLLCGTLCPVGLVLGLIALFWEPRGQAGLAVLIGAAGVSLFVIAAAVFLGGLGALLQPL